MGAPLPPVCAQAVDQYFSKFEDKKAEGDVESKQQEKMSKVPGPYPV